MEGDLRRRWVIPQGGCFAVDSHTRAKIIQTRSCCPSTRLLKRPFQVRLMRFPMNFVSFEDGRRIYTCKRRDLDKLSSVNTLRVDIILQSKACSSTPLVSCLRFLYCEILSQVTTELFSLTCDSIFCIGHKLINIGTFNFLSIASDFPEI